MTRIQLLIDGVMSSDPDFILGSCVTLYREDGRSLWKQRFVVSRHTGDIYVLRPVADTHPGVVFRQWYRKERVRVKVKVIACPSCKQTHPIENFNHACPTGKWCSAALCEACSTIIDGNEPHYCPCR